MATRIRSTARSYNVVESRGCCPIERQLLITKCAALAVDVIGIAFMAGTMSKFDKKNIDAWGHMCMLYEIFFIGAGFATLVTIFSMCMKEPHMKYYHGKTYFLIANVVVVAANIIISGVSQYNFGEFYDFRIPFASAILAAGLHFTDYRLAGTRRSSRVLRGHDPLDTTTPLIRTDAFRVEVPQERIDEPAWHFTGDTPPPNPTRYSSITGRPPMREIAEAGYGVPYSIHDAEAGNIRQGPGLPVVVRAHVDAEPRNVPGGVVHPGPSNVRQERAYSESEGVELVDQSGPRLRRSSAAGQLQHQSSRDRADPLPDVDESHV